MSTKKPVKKPVKKPTKKTPRKSTRKTPRKSDQMLVNTLTRLDGVLAAMPSPVSEPVGGPSAQNMKPGVYFDMLASPNGFTDSHPFDPSAFEGVSPVEPDKEPARPVKGLQRVKRAVRLFEGPLSVFDTWRARLRTDKGVYEIVGPKRIDRHLCDEYGWIELYFGKLTAIKTVKLQELVIVDGCGEVIGVDTRIRDQVLNPEDEATLAYSLNI